MGKVLYVIGGLAVATGVFLIFSALRPISHIDDFAMLIGAPVVMSGITLCLYGSLLLFLGRMLDLMTRIAKKTIWLDAWGDEDRVLVKCPKCAQQLRVAGGKSGMLNCPKCGNKFEAKT
jgi:uncharacterized Zn-finger protein